MIILDTISDLDHRGYHTTNFTIESIYSGLHVDKAGFCAIGN